MMDKLFGSFDGGSPILQFIGKRGYNIYQERELIQMYIHLVLAAIFPIYIGSHASLRRPPSAALPKKLDTEDDEDDLEAEVEVTVEGLTPSDAILFPLAAGITLGGLYLLIKWLNDPKLLNKILGWYCSALGVFGIGRLSADGLQVATTFLFPCVWASRNKTYYVEPLFSQQVEGTPSKARRLVTRKAVEGKTNPFPGALSSISFPPSITSKLWSLRASFKNHWVLRTYIHGICSYKSNIKLNDVIGLVLGISAISLYNYTKAWWLTNLIGFGFCYGTLQLLSPTTFWTGTLVLVGLFAYDIVMVFYTPMMVTVATTLDVPIKLVFPGPKRGSMLGLGDVVLPGIMMALALRFDLYLHYLHKQRTPVNPSDMSASSKLPIIRAPYVNATGVWGERFWTHGISQTGESTIADGARFPKVYFKASLVGYIIAMLVTLAIMNIYHHAQPALLYLVPGVLISLWGTAFIRGEWRLMYGYTEDGSLDSEPGDEKKMVDGRRASDSVGSDGSQVQKQKGSESSGTTVTDSSVQEVAKRQQEKQEHAHHVFLFSLSEPRHGLRKKAKLFKK